MARRRGGRRDRASGPEIHGILLTDKPEGVSSAEVVRWIKRKVGVKVGHLGTLDPFATGLLPICLGEGTKIAQFLNTAGKQYEGTIALGASTDTGDLTGTVRDEATPPPIDDGSLAAVCEQFTGEQLQKPPMYSALKRDGVPLYKLARQGIEVEREARPISIEALELSADNATTLKFRVVCSKGTYVRVLAEDIGQALGTFAHLRTLRRTGFGGFRVDQGAVDPEQWTAESAAGLLSVRQALADLPAVALSERAVEATRRGQAWVLGTVERPAGDREPVLLVDSSDAAVAVVQKEGGRWRFSRVLNI